MSTTTTLPDVIPGEFIRAINFRRGQRDRNEGFPCRETNGSYLDGWYCPDKIVPPSIIADELPMVIQMEYNMYNYKG